MLAQQPIEQIGVVDPKGPQRVIVHRHATAQPTIAVVAPAQSLQCPRAAHPLAGRVKPQRQRQSRRNHRMTRRVLARLDPCLKLTQVDRLHVAPNQPRQMILSEQAIESHRSQFDPIAYRLAQAWRSRPRRTGGRLALLRQLFEQSVATHRHLPRINHRRESQLGCRRLYSSPSCQRFAASEAAAPLRGPRRISARAVALRDALASRALLG